MSGKSSGSKRGVGALLAGGVTFVAALGTAVNFLTDIPQRTMRLCASWTDLAYCESRVTPDTQTAPATPPPVEIALPKDLITVIGPEGAIGTRIAGDLAAYLRPQACPDLRLKLSPISQRDTAAGASASGQPGTYLEGRLTLIRQDSTDEIALVGSGRGPAAFENAYGTLLDSAVGGIADIAGDCIKGSTE